MAGCTAWLAGRMWLRGACALHKLLSHFSPLGLHSNASSCTCLYAGYELLLFQPVWPAPNSSSCSGFYAWFRVFDNKGGRRRSGEYAEQVRCAVAGAREHTMAGHQRQAHCQL